MVGNTASKYTPTIKPEAQARMEPMAKVTEMIRLVLMPSRRAVLRLLEVARMATPNLVL